MSMLLDLLASDVGAAADMLNNAAYWGTSYDVSRPTTAGEWMSPERAMGISTYYACQRNLAEDIAKLPLGMHFQIDERSRRPAPEHRLHSVLRRRPNPEMTAFTFWSTLVGWRLGWGDGIAEIRQSRGGDRIELWPIHRSRIVIRRANNDPNAQKVYEVHADDGSIYELDEWQVFHLRGVGDPLSGYSVARVAAESLGLTMAAQTFGAAFFGNGAHIGGVLHHPKVLSDKAKSHLQESLERAYSTPHKAYRLWIAEEDMKFQSTTVPPEEAQFLETREFQVEEVCRWFRMPPHKVGHLKRAAGWSTLEATNTDYVTDTLMPHLVIIEQEIERKLLARASDVGYYPKHTVAGLLRGDHKTRAEFYKTQLGTAGLTPNEQRALEDRNPSDDPAADELYISTQLVPLSKLGKAAEQSPPPPPQPPGRSPAEAIEVYKRAQAPIFAEIGRRMLTKESNAVTRARKRYADNDPAFVVWLTEFSDRHATDMIEAFAGAVESLALLAVSARGLPMLTPGQAADAQEALAMMVREYCEALRRALPGAVDIEEWYDKRWPARIAGWAGDAVDAIVKAVSAAEDNDGTSN